MKKCKPKQCGIFSMGFGNPSITITLHVNQRYDCLIKGDSVNLYRNGVNIHMSKKSFESNFELVD